MSHDWRLEGRSGWRCARCGGWAGGAWMGAMAPRPGPSSPAWLGQDSFRDCGEALAHSVVRS